MKQKLLLFILSIIGLIFIIAGTNTASAQGITTARISGKISDESGQPVPGAVVRVENTSKGTQFGSAANYEGIYNIPNMDVGGPYTITISFVGFSTYKREKIFLKLGQTFKLDAVLTESVTELEAVEVTNKSRTIDGSRTGAQTNLSEDQINAMPTVSRDLSDFTRLTPQAALTEDSDGELGFSVAGVNNRYNSIFIDGAVNNDVFGLTDQGTNGGQAGISPISIDAIEQFQISIAPYDVTIGGFAGGGINAVTRSGSNKVEGSAYWLFRNETLAGRTPTDDPDVEREKLDEFSNMTYGFRVGGPIVKNKLFFFINGELETRETPQPFDFSTYNGTSSLAEVNNFMNTLKNTYGYDPGTFLNNIRETDGRKVLAKLNYNISDKHKLSVRYSYSLGEAFKRQGSTPGTINFSNNSEFFKSTTHSTAIEWKANFGLNTSNKLILGYTGVRDDRDPLGADFPRLFIDDGAGSIIAGSEAFSTANRLDQDIFTLTNNFNLYKGKHTFTFGTHNEFYMIDNLFVRQNFGEYQYNSLDDFLNDATPNAYFSSYSLVDNAFGDDIENAAGKFNAAQLGFYVQDEFQVSDKLRLTGGVRIDIPIFIDKPPVDNYFNTTTVGLIEDQGYDLMGARSGQMPKTQVILSPRFGFNYDVTGNQTTQIRGGVGLFTSRIPLVWPGGAFTNNGTTVGGVAAFNEPLIIFNPDPYDPYTKADLGGNDNGSEGQMDLFAEDMKFPQVLRTSLAVDQQLFWGIVATAEFMYTKTLNNVLYFNYNVKKPIGNLEGTPDDRPIFDRNDEVDDTYTRIILGTNTNKGYSYNATLQLQKPMQAGFTGSIAYTFGQSRVLNDATSSQNSSQWRYIETVNGRNNLELSRSTFDVGSRIVTSLSYRKEYLKRFATTLSLFYNGQSGDLYSYVYSNGNRMTNQDSGDFDLIYVPKNQNEIILIEKNGVTPEEQWANLNAFIENDKYLSTHRGQYAERNGARTPFSNIIDLRVLQDFFITTASGRRHTLQLSLDIFNFTNLLNKNWGRLYTANQARLIRFEDFEENTNVPTFSYTLPDDYEPYFVDDIGIRSSRWQMQVGARYTF